MRKRTLCKMRKRTLFGLFVFSLVLAMGVGAGAADKEKPRKVVLKMAVAIPTNMPIMELLPRFAKQVALASNGSIEVKIYEPGQLVPAFEIQEAVSKGQINAGWTGTIYLSGKFRAAALFTTIPFGPNVTEYMGWFYYGNGQKLMQELYDRAGFNVKAWPMLFLPTESGGWFRREIKTVEDFKGMKLRWPGLGGKVLSKLGASVSTIPGGEIFPSLERGAIDGTEFANPLMDTPLGLWKVAKYNYFPGWHQTCTAMELVINKKTWERMTKGQQAVIDMAVTDLNFRSIAVTEALAGRILRENEEKHHVKNMIYPEPVLQALNAAWVEVVNEEAAKDEFFKKVWDDLQAYMAEYDVWGCKSYPALPSRCK